MLKTDVDILKEHKEKGKEPDSDLLNFAIMLLDQEVSNQTVQANNKIQEGIRHLRQSKNWANLNRVAKHASEEALLAMEADERIKEKSSISNILQFKKDIMHVGKAEFIHMLNEETIEKYFPEDIDK